MMRQDCLFEISGRKEKIRRSAFLISYICQCINSQRISIGSFSVDICRSFKLLAL